MTTTHALKHNGAAYNDAAALINPDTKVTSGAGRALCTCGILSEQLPSGSARRAWHKEHKLAALDAEVAAHATVDEKIQESYDHWKDHVVATEKAETEALFGQDVLAGTPEDEVSAALAELVADQTPAKKASRKAAKAKDSAEDEPNAYTAELPFTTASNFGYWRSLGRTAAAHLVDTHFPTVTVTPDNKALVLHFAGPEEDVLAAVEAVQALWHEAVLATKPWKQQDAEYLGRSTDPLQRRHEAYRLTEKFYIRFGEQFTADFDPAEQH